MHRRVTPATGPVISVRSRCPGLLLTSSVQIPRLLVRREYPSPQPQMYLSSLKTTSAVSGALQMIFPPVLSVTSTLRGRHFPTNGSTTVVLSSYSLGESDPIATTDSNTPASSKTVRRIVRLRENGTQAV